MLSTSATKPNSVCYECPDGRTGDAPCHRHGSRRDNRGITSGMSGVDQSGVGNQRSGLLGALSADANGLAEPGRKKPGAHDGFKPAYARLNVDDVITSRKTRATPWTPTAHLGFDPLLNRFTKPTGWRTPCCHGRNDSARILLDENANVIRGEGGGWSTTRTAAPKNGDRAAGPVPKHTLRAQDARAGLSLSIGPLTTRAAPRRSRLILRQTNWHPRSGGSSAHWIVLPPTPWHATWSLRVS